LILKKKIEIFFNKKEMYIPKRKPKTQQAINMSIINTPQLQRQFEFAVKDKQGKDEVMMTFIRRANNFSWFDKATTTEQMKMWRKLAKQDMLKITETFETEKFGKMFYCFVLQSTDEDADTICPLGMCLDCLVEGYVYAFRKKENRDATMSYVMKNI